MTDSYNDKIDKLLKEKKQTLADTIVYLELEIEGRDKKIKKLTNEVNRMKQRYEGQIGAGGIKNELVN